MQLRWYILIVFLVGIVGVNAVSVLNTNLSAYYKLDSNATNGTDSIGKINGSGMNGSTKVSIQTIEKKFIGAYNASWQGDTSQDGVQFEQSRPWTPTGTAVSYSIGAWIKPVNISSGVFYQIVSQRWASTRGTWIFGIQDHHLRLYHYNATTTSLLYAQSTLEVNESNWQYVGASWNYTYRAAINFYVNGSMETISSLSSGTSGQLGRNIGGEGTSAGYNGQIDEVAIWNGSVLTKSQWDMLYNSGNGITYENITNTTTSSSGICTGTSDCTVDCTTVTSPITTNQDVGGYNITFTGAASILLHANITNYLFMKIQNGCVIQSKIGSGGFIKS